jgi:hypothetical protein
MNRKLSAEKRLFCRIVMERLKKIDPVMIPQLWTVWDELVRKQKEKRERPARAKSGGR